MSLVPLHLWEREHFLVEETVSAKANLTSFREIVKLIDLPTVDFGCILRRLVAMHHLWCSGSAEDI
jgi:hypothetical protein